MKSHITIYKRGYLSHHAIWTKLALSNIIAVCSYDNGFKTVEINESDLDEATKIIETYFPTAEIIDISDSHFEGVLFRSNYWNQSNKNATLSNTFR